MEEYGLSAKDVAQMVEVSKNRVFGWLSQGLTATITSLSLRLLEKSTGSGMRYCIVVKVKPLQPYIAGRAGHVTT
jgi:hypothetical protein